MSSAWQDLFSDLVHALNEAAGELPRLDVPQLDMRASGPNSGVPNSRLSGSMPRRFVIAQ